MSVVVGDKAAFEESSYANAVSLGFMATAILVSMFLIMAVLEHLFRPPRLPATTVTADAAAGTMVSEFEGSSWKVERHQQGVQETTSLEIGISVLMPGEKYPSWIAKPAPLLPCPREGIQRFGSSDLHILNPQSAS